MRRMVLSGGRATVERSDGVGWAEGDIVCADGEQK